MQTFALISIAVLIVVGLIWLLWAIIRCIFFFGFKYGYRSGRREGAAIGWVDGLLSKPMAERLRRDVNGQFKTLKNK